MKIPFKHEIDEQGNKLEPIEEVTIDVDDIYSSSAIDSLTRRKGNLIENKSTGKGKTRLVFKVPSHGIFDLKVNF